MPEFKDYYAPFKGEKEGISPSLGRIDNYERFTQASARYTQMAGMDVKLAEVRAALGIFSNEKKYQEYRLGYVKFKLLQFIDGAKDKVNNTLPKDKYNELLEIAHENGIAPAEVKALLEDLKIIIVNTPNPTPRPTYKTIVIIASVLLVVIITIVIKMTGSGSLLSKRSQKPTIDKVDPETIIIDLAEAISFLDIQPPEYSKIEEAVKSLKANISQPGAKEGLLKATDIYMRWGDDSPNPEESRSMYQKALECNSAANGSRDEEIKSKLEDLSH
jgi:hypothetical protein